MRAYFFGNMYLSSIQQGLQSGHVLTEMFLRYNYDHTQEKTEMLYKWAKEYKTMILLNGGYSENIRRLHDFFNSDDNSYPYAMFNEGQDALDGALTCAGIILPEKIYEGAFLLRNDKHHGVLNMLTATNTISIEDELNSFSAWEVELMQRLNKFGLAS